MAQRGKAISVKVSRLKVIKALQDSLAKLEAQFKQDEKAQKAYDAEMADYTQKMAEVALKNISKATSLRVNDRWSNEVNIDFNLPANLFKVKKPEQPTREIHEYQYNEQSTEMNNAIRILQMSDEEVISTSTYQAVCRYL